jgi:hypothetical protein
LGGGHKVLGKTRSIFLISRTYRVTKRVSLYRNISRLPQGRTRITSHNCLDRSMNLSPTRIGTVLILAFISIIPICYRGYIRPYNPIGCQVLFNAAVRKIVFAVLLEFYIGVGAPVRELDLFFVLARNLFVNAIDYILCIA